MTDVERLKYLAWKQFQERWIPECKNAKEKIELSNYMMEKIAELRKSEERLLKFEQYD